MTYKIFGRIGKDIFYKDNLIGRFYMCQFISGDLLKEGKPKIQESLQYIRDNIEDIIVKTNARENYKTLLDITKKGRLESSQYSRMTA